LLFNYEEVVSSTRQVLVMGRLIEQDFGRYAKAKGYPRPVAVFLFNPGYRFMLLYRACNQYSKFTPLGFFGRIWYKRMQVKFGFQIPYTTKIGDGLFLGHYGNIVINQGIEIGRNCNIAQGVTLGYVSRGARQGSPKIGNNVWIGANAVVVGNIVIGDRVLIAPLTLVNFDVPENAVVVGNPAKIISYKGSEGYINNTI
jgi:serine O-acetyltransferase